MKPNGLNTKPDEHEKSKHNQSINLTKYNQTAAMDQPVSYPASTGPDPIVVVSSQFCTPHPIDIVIQRKLLLKEGNFAVTDVNGNILFQIKGKLFSLHDNRSILDAAGNPILTLHQKTMTAHRRWTVFRGEENTESKNLLFSIKKSSLIQFKTELDVFMAGNTEEQTCDFKISGSWLDRSCVIYAGNTKDMVIAQMQKKHSVQSVVLGQDTYSVTVCPNVDYAFIVALVAVLEEINADRKGDD